MIKIYTNVVTGYNYNEFGDQFSDGFPCMFFRSTETVQWQLCDNTPQLSEGQTPEDWSKCTQYENYASIGAYLTADNNFTLKLLGGLAHDVTANTAISTITANISKATFATIPKTGIINLFDKNGNIETFEYTNRSIDDGVVTFLFEEDITPQYSYEEDDEIDVGEAVYMQASLDTQTSDIKNGLFCFNITAYSEKLRRSIVYDNNASLAISGLELAIFSINTEDNTISDVNRFLVETFSIRSGVADTSQKTQITTKEQSAIVTTLNALIASGFEVQFSEDGENWHDTQDTVKDFYFRFRSSSTKGTWSTPVHLPQGEKGEDCFVYIAYASDSSGNDFSLTPSNTLEYISFLVSSVAIENPTLEHFTEAGCVFKKYIAQDGATPEINPTTKNWFINGVDTSVCSEGKLVKIQYSVDNTDENWHETFALGDLYCRFSVNDGTTWSSGMKFIGEDAPEVKQEFSETGAVNTWHEIKEANDCYTRFSTNNGETWTDALQVVAISAKIQYSVDSATENFHDTYTSDDMYMRISIDNGSTWTSPMLFTGKNGTSFAVDASGTYSDRALYDLESNGFSYLVTSGENSGYIYFRLGSTTGTWSDGILFTPKGVSIQYAETETGVWHITATENDIYMRISIDGEETWSLAMKFIGESNYIYVAYASDNTGANFSLTPATTLPWRAEFVSTKKIQTPTLQDFTDANVSWLKYIGADWLSGTSLPDANTGNNGDIYLNISDGNLYKKSSGAWSLLINIAAPSVGNATITITQGGVTKGTFSTNQTSNATIELDAGGGSGGGGDENVIETVKVNGTTLTVTDKAVDITVPTALADLNDDSTHRLVTDTEKETWNRKSDFSGKYADLTDLPTIPKVYNGNITINQGGVTKGTFSLNQSGDTTIELDAGGEGGESSSVDMSSVVNVLDEYNENIILNSDIGTVFTFKNRSGLFYTKVREPERLVFESPEYSCFDCPPSDKYEIDYENEDVVKYGVVLVDYIAVFRKYYDDDDHLVTTLVDRVAYPVWKCSKAFAVVMSEGLKLKSDGRDMKGVAFFLSDSDDVYLYATAGNQAKGWGTTTDPANIGNYIGFGEGPVGMCLWDWENPDTVPKLEIDEGTTIGWEYNGVECNSMENCGNLPSGWPTQICMNNQFIMYYDSLKDYVVNIGARPDIITDYSTTEVTYKPPIGSYQNCFYHVLTKFTIPTCIGRYDGRERVIYFISPSDAGCELNISGDYNTTLVETPEAGKRYMLSLRYDVAIGKNL